ncbi:hypothetical protein O181_061904 [Austropuccinia psidii MF-1]|uniref:Uncharacterized protein n=1 Tax=Austropuccinia psidii MF-1 TaxID=1389203 RepID=A0A9Q3I118_9BASI|nr:hypothetical protein [Austropuccinia psidii MF-1]
MKTFTLYWRKLPRCGFRTTSEPNTGYTGPRKPQPISEGERIFTSSTWKGVTAVPPHFRLKRRLFTAINAFLILRLNTLHTKLSKEVLLLDAEGSDELDGEERLQSHIKHNTPRNFQPTLATIPTSLPPALPNPSHTRPALNQAVRPLSIPQLRNSPMVTSQKPQPVASTSRRREELLPLPFPAAQLFECWDQWPIQVTREDANTASENQDGVARLFRRVDRNSR